MRSENESYDYGNPPFRIHPNPLNWYSIYHFWPGYCQVSRVGAISDYWPTRTIKIIRLSFYHNTIHNIAHIIPFPLPIYFRLIIRLFSHFRSSPFTPFDPFVALFFVAFSASLTAFKISIVVMICFPSIALRFLLNLAFLAVNTPFSSLFSCCRIVFDAWRRSEVRVRQLA